MWQVRQDRVCTCVRGLDDATPVQMDLRLQGGAGTTIVLPEIKNPKGFKPMPPRFVPGTGEDTRVTCFKASTPLQPDVYVVELGARDIVGHVSDWQSNGHLVVDTTPPTTGRVREHVGDAHEADCLVAAGTHMAIHVDWDGFAGDSPRRE